eukprot:m.33360 g.33360  ORF g.33360 m.33360 type:complete len:396 (-) comp12538_c0_seq1:92-1279(-)
MEPHATVPSNAAVEAHEMASRMRNKKREGLLDQRDGQCAGGKRHKERTALGKIDGNATHTEAFRSSPDPDAPVKTADGGVNASASDDNVASSTSDVLATSSDVAISPQSVESALEFGPRVDAFAGPIADMTVDDPHHVPEYVDEIFEYLQATESKFMPKPKYMRKQKDINHSMRSILADWLIEVAQEYKLDPQTLFIAVGYIDRFLSEMSVNRTKLQLVGVTAMLLAAKYEEIYPPAVDEFVYITDNTYSRDQILKMEHLILKVLQFDMGGVTPYSFVQRFLVIANADSVTKDLAMYLLESTLQDGERYMKYKPSLIAAGALCNALYATKQPCWTPTLVHYSKLSVEDISECVQDMYYTFSNAATAPQQAVREKYSSHRFSAVSQIPPPLTPPLH